MNVDSGVDADVENLVTPIKSKTNIYKRETQPKKPIHYNFDDMRKNSCSTHVCENEPKKRNVEVIKSKVKRRSEEDESVQLRKTFSESFD